MVACLRNSLNTEPCMQARMLEESADERAKHKAAVVKWETLTHATAAQVTVHVVHHSLHACIL